jgi:hypothetical protein
VEAASKTQLTLDRNKTKLDASRNNNTTTNRSGPVPKIDAEKKEAPKMSTKLGIPLRWLKPAAKPKRVPPEQKPVIQTGGKLQISDPLNGTTSTATVVAAKAPMVANSIGKKPSSTAVPSSPPHTSNRMVTDSSEGGSTASPRDVPTAAAPGLNKTIAEKVPAAIVTKTKAAQQKEPKVRMVTGSPLNSATHVDSHTYTSCHPKDETAKLTGGRVPCVDSLSDAREGGTRRNGWDSEAGESSDSSDSDTEDDDDDDDDDDELSQWESSFLGPRPSLSSSSVEQTEATDHQRNDVSHKIVEGSVRPKLKIRLSAAKLQLLSNSLLPEGANMNSLPGKLSMFGTNHVERGEDGVDKESEYKLERKATKKKKRKNKMIPLSALQPNRAKFDVEKARIDMEEERRKREEAKPLTSEQIRAILGDDEYGDAGGRHWVRRSVRQPSKALLNSKPVRMLIDKLKMNDRDMVVLKMKKYINDPNAPSAVLDAALNAMEENTNCEALYIQVKLTIY